MLVSKAHVVSVFVLGVSASADNNADKNANNNANNNANKNERAVVQVY